MFPKFTLILGGANSGKSAFAEKLVKSGDKSRVYLATAQATDPEMSAKIARHRQLRGPGWRMIEAPIQVANCLAEMKSTEIVLLDCATLWLSNHMARGSDIAGEQAGLLVALADCRAPVVVVSNEVGLGGVAPNAVAREFGRLQGGLNIALAELAELVVLVTAGLPAVLKGKLRR